MGKSLFFGQEIMGKHLPAILLPFLIIKITTLLNINCYIIF